MFGADANVGVTGAVEKFDVNDGAGFGFVVVGVIKPANGVANGLKGENRFENE